ncbi:DUF4097 family beta strand repeat-containing protein [Actinosynnema sp. NPDC047251]|uniref:DUF4097 domain-containing protein n=1 Tax=Saccharothrix espanaensis (strain ATCC 51144 / DSM 44229 / JCM 9112 / NBRC 15066 / NRRL 15764) TaxID=1179773 RepID=K0K851_SACES|nr:DUF4097 family beta strand repeat-containing protein [Saccharothrix espanaensis]CCH33702.1 hypothetical protein BN6_64590 [Saccharothrix espanaensis DSM 44229]
MPTFATPEPIAVTLDLVMGTTRITAGHRADTVVELRPGDPARENDLRAVEQTRVEFEDGRLLVKSPKVRGIFNKGGAVDVTIHLPTGSTVQGNTAMGSLFARGGYGEFRFKSAAGDVEVERSGPTYLRTAMGNLVAVHVTGEADVLTGSGDLRVDHVAGSAVARNSNGAIRLGEVTGAVRAQNANGDVVIDRALADVTAKTANGSVRIDEVVRGNVVLETAAGRLEVGIREGSAAWLDVRTVLGAVHNSLESATGPESGTETVEVRARNGFGDIVIRRAPNKED